MTENNSPNNNSEVKDIFKPQRNAESRQRNFYNHFLSTEIISKISQQFAQNYTNKEEGFDDETGEVITTKETQMSQEQIKNKFWEYASRYAKISKENITLVEGIPIVRIDEVDLVREEYQDAGAFVVKNGMKTVGIILVGEKINKKDLQHELVHIAVSELGVGNLKTVYPEYDQFEYLTVAKNQEDINKFELAKNFLDEALAYGTNAFENNFQMTPELIKSRFFYAEDINQIGNYDINYNSKVLCKIFNETIKDDSGKKQFRLNYFLLKHFQKLEDLDFQNPESKSKFVKITGINLDSL